MALQQYVITPWLTPARVVSTTNVSGTYSNGPLNNGNGATLTVAASSLTIDSVVCVVGDRVLLSGQSAALQNGIYIVFSIGSTVVLQRASDQQSQEQLQKGQYITVAAGTTNAGTAFTLVEPLPAQLGVNNLVWQSSISAGTGTAATKDASDNGQPTVASVSGSTTANALAVFADTAGTVKAASTTTTLGQPLIVSGNVSAGLSGTSGALASFPAAASKGSLILQGVANTGNTNTTISNVAMGQASVVSIPDPAGATANFVVAPAALVSGNFLSASGTAGLAINSGIAVTSVTQVASVAMTAAQFNGMYAAPFLLIAAPGANNQIVIDKAYMIMTYVSAAYAAGGVVSFQYDSTALGAGDLASNGEAAADFFQTASSVFSFSGNTGNTLGLTLNSTAVNKGIYLSNLTQAFTTGDSTWVVKIYYRVIAVA